MVCCACDDSYPNALTLQRVVLRPLLCELHICTPLHTSLLLGYPIHNQTGGPPHFIIIPITTSYNIACTL